MSFTTSPRHTLRILTAAGLSLAVAGTVAACRTADTPLPAAAAAPASPGAPMLVNCAPGHQPLIRQVAVQGAWVPQVECVAADGGQRMAAPQLMAPPPMATVQQTPVPMLATPVHAPAPVPVPPAAAASYEPSVVARRPAPRRVVYDEDVVEYRSPKKGRSWQKSAIIIGSSAGVGAGVGAATGGKKGALIGAAIGGGAATIWDQATRR